MISKHCVAVHLRATTLAAAQRKQPAKPIKFTKTNLPSKVCVVCGRPFEWRKKWEKVSGVWCGLCWEPQLARLPSHSP